MRKQEDEALRRLEAALMEPEYPEETPEDPLEELEQTWREISDVDYAVYNTDEADVDLEAYSQEVCRGRRSSLIPVLITILALGLLAAMLLWLLRCLGVMGWRR